MSGNRIATLIHWTPRILGILMTIFVSLFALDVFSEDYTWWEALLALIIHLLPFAGLLLVAVIAGWRLPRLGGLMFIGFGVLYLFIAWAQDPLAMLLLAGVPILIGTLFLLDDAYRQRHSASPA